MPLQTLQATVNQTPDPGFGTDQAVTTPSNTGHAATSMVDNGIPATQLASCRWSAFPNPSARRTKITVKFDWQIINGGGVTDISAGGTASADASYIITMSLDGGANFTQTLLTRSGSCSGNNSFDLAESGSVAFDISTLTQDISQVQIRDRLRANAVKTGAGSANASMNAVISNIKIEVTTNPTLSGGAM